LKVTAEPLPEDRLLFMHSTIATAEIEEGKLEWTVSVAGVTLSQRVIFTDGTEVTETMDLQPMLQKWGTGVVAEHVQPLDAPDPDGTEAARRAIQDHTLTAVLDALGIQYSVDLPDEGGVDITIYEQTIEQD